MISPLLANIYLHEVLDVWFEQDGEAAADGAAFLIRYADDFVIGSSSWRDDARRVLDVLPKRFGKYGLTLHPDKTRLVRFEPPRSEAGTAARRTGEASTFSVSPTTGEIAPGLLGGEAEDRLQPL